MIPVGRRFGFRRRIAVWLLTCAFVLAGSQDLAAREPLMQDGTTSIPQRILTHPGATVVETPGADAAVEEPTPFTLCYVFERQEHDGATWVLVGANRDGDVSGWLPADQTVDWRQTMVLSFTSPADRSPVLFFDTRENMITFVEHESLPTLAPDYVEAARAGQPPEGSGVVAVEPAEAIDFSERFYLLPILNAEQVHLSASMRRSKIFEIASIPLDEAESAPDQSGEPRVGVVFVIDTTMSMQPYIDRTRAAVSRVIAELEGSSFGDRVSFGLVGFRDATGGLAYAAQLYAPLDASFDASAFLRAMDGMQAATEATRGFNEDGLAGIMTALELDAWKDFDAKFIIYIGDSGVREYGGDGGSVTGLSAARVNAIARDDGVGIVPILLKTPNGRAYHALAEGQLRQLAFVRDDWAQPFYTVDGGTPDAFAPVIDDVARRLVAQVETSSATSGPSASAVSNPGLDCTDPDNVIDCMGYAMRLAWLGREQGSQAPRVLRAWVPQIALDDPINGSSFDVNILLTRDQVNNLYARLGLVINAADRLMGEDPALLFDVLSTVIAEASNDPTTLQGLDPTQAIEIDLESLPNLGALLGEHFGHLPFQTPLMGISRDEWQSMDGGERDRVLTDVRSAGQMLKHYYEQADRWIPLHPEASDGERVYPLPFEVLP